MDLVTINFWDSFSSVRTNQQTDPNKDTSSPSSPTTVAAPVHVTTTTSPVEEEGTGTSGPAAGETTTTTPGEPSRDEVTDPSRGDQEGESRDEEKTDNNHDHQVATTTECQHDSTARDVSVFSTLTELFFNPFLDGYCQTPFCSDADYLPPSCPSAFYSAPQQQVTSKMHGGHHPAHKHHHHHPIHSHNHHPVRAATSQQQQDCDEFGDISRSNSGNSSGHSSNANAAVAAARKRHRQRPLAFAVGHGDEWKDLEGRRVVITRSGGSGTTSPPTRRSPYRYRQQPPPPPQQHPHSPRYTSNPAEPNLSPHQTKSILGKDCQQIQDLEIPASYSSGTLSSHSHTPLL